MMEDGAKAEWPNNLLIEDLYDSGDDPMKSFGSDEIPLPDLAAFAQALQPQAPQQTFLATNPSQQTFTAPTSMPFSPTFQPFSLPFSVPTPQQPQQTQTPLFVAKQEEFAPLKDEFAKQQDMLMRRQEEFLREQEILRHASQKPSGLPSSQVVNLLEQMWEHLRRQNQELAEVLNAQRRLVSESPMSKALFDQLRAAQAQLKSKLDSELAVMEEIFGSSILSINQLIRWQSLMTQLKIQMKQLELYQKELIQLVEPSPTPQVAVALVVTEQPPASTFFKEKPSTEPFCLQLLTGAITQLTSANKLKANVVCESNQWRPRGAAKVMSEDTKVMDLQQQVTQFQPKFLVGTRKFVVNLGFSLRVRAFGPGGAPGALSETEYAVESDVSNPFVVITNESQWAEAEGTLIKKEVFGSRTEVPWPYLANVFHLHFIHATRQDVARPARTLQYAEIAYVHDKWFQGKPTVSIKDFDNFWTKWFGKNIHQIRYQRNIGNMWKCGLIYGLMGKDDIERALVDERPGSFIIRFSENHSGLFAIAYKHVEGVKHYLVKPDDLSAKKGLADFVNEHPIFVYLMRIATNGEGQPHLIAESKDAVLSPYLSDRPAIADPGYEKLPGQL